MFRGIANDGVNRSGEYATVGNAVEDNAGCAGVITRVDEFHRAGTRAEKGGAEVIARPGSIETCGFTIFSVKHRVDVFQASFMTRENFEQVSLEHGGYTVVFVAWQ